MNPLHGLSDYLRKLERNLRLLAFTRGAAMLGAAALLFTVALVLIANRFSFSAPSVFWSRIVLFLAVAAALAVGLVWPLLRLNRRRAARLAEERYPEFQQRLLTFTEKSKANADDPFLPLLAADALEVADRRRDQPLVPKSWIISFGSVAAAAITVLLWLGAAGPGFLGYGTALLWGSNPSADRKPLYTVTVQPGSHRIRRRSDQTVSASVNGFTASKVSVFAKYASSTKWEEAPMQPRPGSNAYEFLFAAVPEDVEYYVSAGGVRSNSYKLTVVDLPAVQKLKVTYHYPGWLGLKNETEDPGGDLRAVEGTEAEVEVQTDKPLTQASILLDTGGKIELTPRDGKLFARVPIQKDDMYHVATPDGGELVRLTENYFIEARKDTPPTVSITHPGKDAKVSPIEEVTVNVQGRDDFGLQGLDLHYSVNGGDENTVAIANARGRKEADGATTLPLEDYKLVPGDVISIYATARDARNTSKTDIYFIQAEPFEREYSQSQQQGGGGGQGEEQQKISEREKEIISATWNQLKGKEKTSAAENAKYLAGVQQKLAEQAQSLANRMKARQLSDNNPAFKSFTEDMEKAVASMNPAKDQLGSQKWKDALPPEQKALQYLLRAEATFRQIQVAFGKGGGGGGSQGASRDLENMFDLELDTEKNQYESGQQSAADKKQKEVDDALAKLKELAKRQEELAAQQQKTQNFQQRWQQEMLRREAEELRRQLEQLSRDQSGEQGSQSQSGQQSQQSQSGQSGQSGQQSSSASNRRGQQQGQGGQQNRQLEQALNRLSEATREMSSSASAQARAQQQQGGSQSAPQGNGSQGQAQAAQAQANARRAAERLGEARDMLAGMRNQQSGDALANLARDAERLAQQQESFDSRMRKNFGSGQGFDPSKQQTARDMAQEKQGMIDELNRLEQGMQRAARDTADSQPKASRKLRDSLGRMQGEELQNRMGWVADALRRGMGSYAVMREAPVTQALNQTRDELRAAQNAMNPNAPGAGDKGDSKTQQALAQAEKLRQDLEQMARNGQGGKGKSPGNQPGQRGPSGQQGQSGEGNQPSPDGQGGQQGQSGDGSQQQVGGQPGNQGGGQQAGARGNGPRGGPGPAYGEGGDYYSNAVRDVGRLQQAVRDNPDLARQTQDLARDLGRMNPRNYPSDPNLLQSVISRMLGDAEQIELTLRRKADANNGPHTATPQNVPPGYANAVAEYYRRLSKGQ